jgi:hypothetical protein
MACGDCRGLESPLSQRGRPGALSSGYCRITAGAEEPKLLELPVSANLPVGSSRFAWSVITVHGGDIGNQRNTGSATEGT